AHVGGAPPRGAGGRRTRMLRRTGKRVIGSAVSPAQHLVCFKPLALTRDPDGDREEKQALRRIRRTKFLTVCPRMPDAGFIPRQRQPDGEAFEPADRPREQPAFMHRSLSLVTSCLSR